MSTLRPFPLQGHDWPNSVSLLVYSIIGVPDPQETWQDDPLVGSRLGISDANVEEIDPIWSQDIVSQSCDGLSLLPYPPRPALLSAVSALG